MNKKKRWIHIQTERKRVVREEVEVAQRSRDELPVEKVLKERGGKRR